MLAVTEVEVEDYESRTYWYTHSFHTGFFVRARRMNLRPLGRSLLEVLGMFDLYGLENVLILCCPLLGCVIIVSSTLASKLVPYSWPVRT